MVPLVVPFETSPARASVVTGLMVFVPLTGVAYSFVRKYVEPAKQDRRMAMAAIVSLAIATFIAVRMNWQTVMVIDRDRITLSSLRGPDVYISPANVIAMQERPLRSMIMLDITGRSGRVYHVTPKRDDQRVQIEQAIAEVSGLTQVGTKKQWVKK